MTGLERRLENLTDEYAKTEGGRRILADVAHRYLENKIAVDELPPQQPVELPLWAAKKIAKILKACAQTPD